MNPATTSAARSFCAVAVLATGMALPMCPQTSLEGSVDLIVRDRHGRVVRDLKPENLEITEDGQKVTVRRLELRTLNATADGSATDAGGRFVSLVIDELGDSGGQVPRDVMQQMMKRLGDADIYFSVWRVRDRVQLVQSFTRDEAALKESLGGWRKSSQAKPKESSSSSSTASADIQAVDEQTLKTASEMVRDQHSRPAAALLFAMAQEQGKLPGRKTVLYVSDGLQVNGLTSSDLSAITGVANRSRVSIYTIDISGISDLTANAAANLYRDTMLMSAMMDQARSGPSYRNPNGDSNAFSGTTHVYGVKSQQPNNQLKKLALDTGGIYSNERSVRAVVDRAAEDVSTYYEVIYSATNHKYDGHFCPMTVTVHRAGVQAQARSGYFSMPPFGLRDISPFEVPLLNALTATERKETIWFQCAVLPETAERQGTATSRLRVAVPINGLVARENDNTKRFQLHVAMLALVRAEDGSVLKKLSRDVLLEGPLESLPQARKQIYKFNEPFSVSTSKYRLDVAVADQNAGKLSTKTIDLMDSKAEDTDWAGSAEQPEDVPTRAEHAQHAVELEERQGYEDTSKAAGLIAPPQLLPNAVRPGDAELRSILEGARQRIREYKRGLPDFVCLMLTKRFVDAPGRAAWKLDDSYASALRYNGLEETTMLLDVNGKRVRGADQDGLEGVSVRGEFGETLGMIFSDRANAQVDWVGMAQVLGARTHVFRCSVRAQNSDYKVAVNHNLWLHAAYHAFVYVDAGSLCVRRLTVLSDDIPPKFPIRESDVSIDYDYIPIAGHEYLLPVEATLFLRMGRRYVKKNEIEFQNYHKYVAESRLR